MSAKPRPDAMTWDWICSALAGPACRLALLNGLEKKRTAVPTRWRGVALSDKFTRRV